MGFFEKLAIQVVAWTPTLVLFIAGFLLGWAVSKPVIAVLRRFFAAFNRGFDRVTIWYGNMVGVALRLSPLMLLIYVGLMGLTYLGFRSVPTGFIPEQDKAYMFVAVQLPDGASLDRTEDVMRGVVEIGSKIPGVAHTISIPGFSFLSPGPISPIRVMFLTLKPFDERGRIRLSPAPAILQRLRGELFQIEDAMALAFPPPAVDGIGTTGGFKMQVQDRGDSGPAALQGAIESVMGAVLSSQAWSVSFSTFCALQPAALFGSRSHQDQSRRRGAGRRFRNAAGLRAWFIVCQRLHSFRTQLAGHGASRRQISRLATRYRPALKLRGEDKWCRSARWSTFRT